MRTVVLALTAIFLLVACGNEQTSSEPSGSDSSEATDYSFGDLAEMATAYEALVPEAECESVEAPEPDQDVTSVYCSGPTDDSASDTLVYVLDDSGPVQERAEIEISMGGSPSASIAHAEDWKWAVVSESVERLDAVGQNSDGAASETYQP